MIKIFKKSPHKKKVKVNNIFLKPTHEVLIEKYQRKVKSVRK
jgi:hypothetical protein